MAKYIGFSTKNFDENKTFRLTDIEIVKEDLKNHIFTNPRERIMEDIGTNIPNLLFEPITQDLLDQIYDELTEVFEYDPRVEIINLQVTSLDDQNVVLATTKLFFIEFDVIDDLNIAFEFDN